MRKSHCIYCGRAFTPSRSDQLYCSKQCRLKSYRSGVLAVPVKAEIFDRIATGTQTEVYRDIIPYWTNRFGELFGWMLDISCTPPKVVWNDAPKMVAFRNGTGEHMRWMEAECTIREGAGREEWGAMAGKEYYILTVRQIVKHDTGKDKEKNNDSNDSKLCKDS